MEWVLQVADELDDAFGVLRHGWLGLVAEPGAFLLATIGIGAALAGPALGEPIAAGQQAVVPCIAPSGEVPASSFRPQQPC